MIKLSAKATINKICIALAIILCLNIKVKAQTDCRSIMGTYFKPSSEKSSLNWAGELTLSPGVMKDRTIFNGMAFLGLDYVSESNSHQFYFEGAYKYWHNSKNGPGLNGAGTGFSDFNKPEKKHFGFRELFYSYNKWINVKTGIQSLKTTESMLFDERMLGISVSKKTGPFSFYASGGTVYDDIARMQDVCGTRHLYNLIRGNKVNFVGDKIFDSNFVLTRINLSPGQNNASIGKEPEDFDSFENNDEFSDFSSEEQEKKNSFLKLKNLGIFAYEEFGEVFHEYKYYGGINFQFELFKSLELNLESFQQFMKENDATFYKAKLSKEKFWNNGSFSTLGVEYLGISKTDNSKHFPSFTNLFKGEVMRLDMMHLPLMEIGFSHKTNRKLKSGFECKYIHQFKNEKARELDLTYSIQPWRNLHLFAIGSYVSSEAFENDNFLIKLEARVAF